MDMNDETALRVVALQAATESASNCGCCRDVVKQAADEYFEWLTRRIPATISLAVGEVEKQPQQEEQNPMQIHDDEQFSVTLTVKDAKGAQITGDQITVTVDNSDVVSAEALSDGSGYNLVAGNPGSAVVTFNAGTDDNGHEVVVTEAVDVVPGNVATVQITEGTVSKQGAPAGGTSTPGTPSTPADGQTGTPADTGTGAGTATGTPVDTGTGTGTTPEGGVGAPAI